MSKKIIIREDKSLADLTGQSIGRYHILEQLGQGGMATVYKAFDSLLKRDVAFKIIRKEAFPSEVHGRIHKRFEREAQVLARLSHPNIVKVFDFGDVNGAPYLVMDYVPGKTLKEVQKPLKYFQAISLVLQVAQALEHAHKNGILHRDVKPSNILINSAGVPMLADFGIAKLMELSEDQSLTGTGVGIGTPEYMAPEQSLGKNVDGRADIYALGVVLFELITGQKPFTADTPMAIVIKHINDPLPSISQFKVDVPKTVEIVIFKALAKRPEDRYGDMGAFITALKEIQEGTHDFKQTSAGNHIGQTTSNRNTPLEILDHAQSKASVDLTTRDILIPEGAASPTSSDSKPVKIRKKSLLFLFGFITVIGMLSLGIFLVYQTLSSTNLLAPFSTNENLITPATFTSGVINSQTLTQTPVTQMPMPVTTNTASLVKQSFAPDVIQLTNILNLDEIYQWDDPSYSYRSLVTWQQDSHGFFIAEYGYGFSQYDIFSYSVSNFKEDMRNIYMSAFSPGGSLYVTSNKEFNQIKVWQYGTDEIKFNIDGEIGHPSSYPVFSPDGRIMAGLMDNALQFWETNEGHPILTLEQNLSDTPWVQTYKVFAFSPDSKYFAAGKPYPGEIKIWDVDSGTLLQTLHWHEGLSCLSFSPDGNILASGGHSINNRDIIRFWDINDGTLKSTIQKSNESATSMVYSLDGQILISGSVSGTVRIWRVADGTLLETLYSTEGEINKVSLSPDGKYLLTVGEKLILWGIQNQ
jgi:serine/threonine protein kinase